MTTPNAELAYRVLDHIDAHPEQWNQGLYIGKAECGTVGCFAGWAVMLSGAEPVNFYPSHPGHMPVGLATDEVKVDGKRWAVSAYAEELLGADRYVDKGTDYERDLFGGDNTREDLGRLVAEIFGPRPDGAA